MMAKGSKPKINKKKPKPRRPQNKPKPKSLTVKQAAESIISLQTKQRLPEQAFMIEAFDVMHKYIATRMGLTPRHRSLAVVAANGLEMTNFVNRAMQAEWKRTKSTVRLHFDRHLVTRLIEGYEASLKHLGQNHHITALIRASKQALRKTSASGKVELNLLEFFDSMPVRQTGKHLEQGVDTKYFERALSKALGKRKAVFRGTKSGFINTLTAELRTHPQERISRLARLF